MTRAPTPERSTDPRLTAQLVGLESLGVRGKTRTQQNTECNGKVASDMNKYCVKGLVHLVLKHAVFMFSPAFICLCLCECHHDCVKKIQDGLTWNLLEGQGIG